MPDLRTECKEQVKNFELWPKKTFMGKAMKVLGVFLHKHKSTQPVATDSEAIMLNLLCQTFRDNLKNVF